MGKKIFLVIDFNPVDLPRTGPLPTLNWEKYQEYNSKAIKTPQGKGLDVLNHFTGTSSMFSSITGGNKRSNLFPGVKK